MERFEHPNEKGALPRVMIKYVEAEASCEARGRRLCTEAEWTLACEGPERTPYPYGYKRDAEACPIDKPSPLVNERRLFNPRTQKAELERLDQRDPSGTYARCRSAYGVYDLTGRRVGHQPRTQALRAQPQGGPLGRVPQPLSPRHPGSRSGLLLLPNRLSLLPRPARDR